MPRRFFAVKPCRVRFVDHQPCAVLLFERDDLCKRGEIAVHREHRLGDDEDTRERAGRGEDAAPTDGFESPGFSVGAAFLSRFPAHCNSIFQLPHVFMWIHTDRSAALACAVNDAGVVELVENDDVAFADERGDRADVGGIAAAEDDGGFLVV